MSLKHGTSIVRNGLVLHLDAANTKSYPGTGSSWNDLSGNNNNATLVNGPTYKTDDSKYFTFDGVNDHATIPNSSSLSSFTNKLTISIWFKRKPGTIQRLVNKFDAAESATFKVTIGSGERLFFEINDGTTRYILGNLFPAYSGDWENFVFTYDGSNRYIYQNTNLIASDSFSNTMYNNSHPVTIGATILSDVLYTNVDICGCMIYNRALGITEIKQNFEATRGRYGI